MKRRDFFKNMGLAIGGSLLGGPLMDISKAPVLPPSPCQAIALNDNYSSALDPFGQHMIMGPFTWTVQNYQEMISHPTIMLGDIVHVVESGSSYCVGLQGEFVKIWENNKDRQLDEPDLPKLANSYG